MSVRPLICKIRKVVHLPTKSVDVSSKPRQKHVRRYDEMWKYVGKKQIRRMSKLDQQKVQYIVREKSTGTKNSVIAEQMDISVHCIQKLFARYKNVEPN